MLKECVSSLWSTFNTAGETRSLLGAVVQVEDDSSPAVVEFVPTHSLCTFLILAVVNFTIIALGLELGPEHGAPRRCARSRVGGVGNKSLPKVSVKQPVINLT